MAACVPMITPQLRFTYFRIEKLTFSFQKSSIHYSVALPCLLSLRTGFPYRSFPQQLCWRGRTFCLQSPNASNTVSNVPVVAAFQKRARGSLTEHQHHQTPAKIGCQQYCESPLVSKKNMAVSTLRKSSEWRSAPNGSNCSKATDTGNTTGAMFSSGLAGVVAGESAISSVSSNEGEELTYRGYKIADLAEKASFEEVLFLLLHKRLPTLAELATQQKTLAQCRLLPPMLLKALELIPRTAHPMDVLRCGCSLLGTIEPETDRFLDPPKLGLRLIGAYSSMLFYWYHFSHNGLRISLEEGSDSVSAHFLKLLNYNNKTYKLDRPQVRAVDVSLINYAEHEFNASTFAARVTAATQSDFYSAICSAIGTLRGPLHGGANEAAERFLTSLESIQHAEDVLESMWARKEKVMGFGHRVYKKGDPRSPLMMKVADTLAAAGYKPQLLKLAKHVENLMQKKNICSNVDFPCAVVYAQCGIPVSMFTPLFVIARTAGWTAHIIEQREMNKLIRPISRYVGPSPRVFKSIELRDNESSAWKVQNSSELSRL